MIVAWLAAAGDRCIQQCGISIQEVLCTQTRLERVNGGFLTIALPTATGPNVCAGLGGWAY